MLSVLQFVNFERVEDAQRAFSEKNNAVVPALTGSMPLTMRFKAPKVRSPILDRLARVCSITGRTCAPAESWRIDTMAGACCPLFPSAAGLVFYSRQEGDAWDQGSSNDLIAMGGGFTPAPLPPAPTPQQLLEATLPLSTAAPVSSSEIFTPYGLRIDVASVYRLMGHFWHLKA